MSVLAKTDSEVSSLSQSSTARSPRRLAYYVQSPSRDSHDGEKTTNSSPVLGPMGSPPHSHSNSSLGRHCRESASTHFSGSHNENHHGGESHLKGWRPWKVQFGSIEEEGLLDVDGTKHGLTSRCYFFVFIEGFLGLFSLFSSNLRGASRPQKPIVTMKSIAFDQFVVQAGEDFSGVATNMLSMKSSLKFTFCNPATFFGVHVKSTPLDLSYSRLAVVTGTIIWFMCDIEEREIETYDHSHGCRDKSV